VMPRSLTVVRFCPDPSGSELEAFALRLSSCAFRSGRIVVVGAAATPQPVQHPHARVVDWVGNCLDGCHPRTVRIA